MLFHDWWLQKPQHMIYIFILMKPFMPRVEAERVHLFYTKNFSPLMDSGRRRFWSFYAGNILE